MTEVYLQLALTIVSAAVSVLAAYLVYKLQSRDKKRAAEAAAVRKQREEKETAREAEREALKAGVTAMLRDRLIQSCEYYAKQGWISPRRFQNIASLYEAYHGLGGNDIVTQLYTDTLTLPHVPLAEEGEE